MRPYERVYRSLSSEGAHARQVLRECDGLVEAVLVVVSAAVSDQTLVDDCVIEHCVCLLRNISFACQEVVEPDYLDCKKSRGRSARSSNTESRLRLLRAVCGHRWRSLVNTSYAQYTPPTGRNCFVASASAV